MKSFKASRDSHQEMMDSRGWDSIKSLIQEEQMLDEVYYPSLDYEVLEEQNNDQVVSRECRKNF
jgi:hypothetical protein